MDAFNFKPDRQSPQGSLPLEAMVGQMAEATRSLGWEEGTDLLLQLIYLRWALHQSVGGWSTFRDDLLTSPQPADALERALEAYVPFWHTSKSVVAQDGGHALLRTVHTLADWPLDDSAPQVLRSELHAAFEAVLRMRSQRLSRAGVEQETPGSAARLMARLVPLGGRILDPACGIASALLESANAAQAAHAAIVALAGWEINAATAARARMRFDLADHPLDLHVGDAISEFDDFGTFDAVLMQPPWGLQLNDRQLHALHRLPSWQWKRASGDSVWLYLAATALAPGGRAAALMSHQMLVRGRMEGEMRRWLVAAGIVEAVIALPSGLIPSTSLPAAMVVLRPAASSTSHRDVLFIDAGTMVERRRGRGELTEEGIERLVEIVARWRDEGVVAAPDYVAAAAPIAEVMEAGDLLPVGHLATPPTEQADRPAPPRELLTELHVENFKSFGREQRVPLAPITLIYGPNSAGKSSLLQILLLLKQSLAARSLVTQRELTDAGSFTGVLHRHDLEQTLKLGLAFGASERWEIPAGVPNPQMTRSVDLTFRADGSGLPRQDRVVIGFGEFEMPFLAVQGDGAEPRLLVVSLEDLAPVFDGVAEGTLLYPFDSRHAPPRDEDEASRRLRSRQQNGRRALRLLREAGMTAVPAIADGLLPTAQTQLDPVTHALAGSTGRDPGIVNSYVNRSMQLAAGVAEELRLLISDLSYLGPLRSPPQRIYNRAAAAVGAGTAGEHIALHLFDNSSEVTQVNEWLAALDVPYTLKVVPVIASGSTAVVGDLVAIVLTDQRSSVEVSPADVGFGVSQVLPIVAELLAKQSSVICIEQPEIHLHPALQAKLGDLLIEATSREGRANQVLVETHSEHLMLRLQRRIRDGVLDPADISVVYIDQDEAGQARALQLRLDSEGDFLDEWPQGFFEERLDEVFGGDQ